MSGQDHVEMLHDHTLSRGECCVQAQELHPVGTVIGHELSEDNCTEVTTQLSNTGVQKVIWVGGSLGAFHTRFLIEIDV